MESGREIRGRFWELSTRGRLAFFFHAIDHLSDREFTLVPRGVADELHDEYAGSGVN